MSSDCSSSFSPAIPETPSPPGLPGVDPFDKVFSAEVTKRTVAVNRMDETSHSVLAQLEAMVVNDQQNLQSKPESGQITGTTVTKPHVGIQTSSLFARRQEQNHDRETSSRNPLHVSWTGVGPIAAAPSSTSSSSAGRSTASSIVQHTSSPSTRAVVTKQLRIFSSPKSPLSRPKSLQQLMQSGTEGSIDTDAMSSAASTGALTPRTGTSTGSLFSPQYAPSIPTQDISRIHAVPSTSRVPYQSPQPQTCATCNCAGPAPHIPSTKQNVATRPSFGRSISEGLRVPTRSLLASLPEHELPGTGQHSDTTIPGNEVNRKSVLISGVIDKPQNQTLTRSRSVRRSLDASLPGGLAHAHREESSWREQLVPKRPPLSRRGSSTSRHSFSSCRSEAPNRPLHDAPSSAQQSPSFGLQMPDTFDTATAEAVRQAAAQVMSSSSSRAVPFVNSHAVPATNHTAPASNGKGGLMGSCGNGFFGRAVRSKVADILDVLIPDCTPALQEDIVNIVEYDYSNSSSPQLIHDIIQRIAEVRLHDTGSEDPQSLPSYCVTHADEPSTDFRPMATALSNPSCERNYTAAAPQVFSSFAGRHYGGQIAPPSSVSLGYSLMDMHFRRMSTFGGVTATVAANEDMRNFLDARAKEFKQDGVLVLAFISKKDDDDTLTLTPSPSIYSNERGVTIDAASGAIPARVATHAKRPSHSWERSSSLSRRSYGFDNSKDCSLWSGLPALLAPCMQRLVSTGLINGDTAHKLLNTTLYPRSPSQIQNTLRTCAKNWHLEWSCGLPEPEAARNSPKTPDDNACDSHSPSFPIHEEVLCLAHPAYTALNATTMSRIQFAEHAQQFIRVLYDSHFRTVLRDQGKFSRGRIEEIMDSLNDTLREKLEDPDRAVLKLEMDVCVLALRRL